MAIPAAVGTNGGHSPPYDLTMKVLGSEFQADLWAEFVWWDRRLACQ
jgi:hypothetical protein